MLVSMLINGSFQHEFRPGRVNPSLELSITLELNINLEVDYIM